ncbi:MAG: ammonia-forming cytochrome c nitrite reductase [Bacteroidetes bacterium]|nr:ammonia-forming cytochrome c nitrite reductase [Bacteroidota bacterium]
MKRANQNSNRKAWVNWVLFVASIVVVFLLGLLASSITERRVEAVFAYQPRVKLSEFEPRNSEWGKNYPMEYESYMKTSDTSFRTLYNGNAVIDMLEVDPRLVVLWVGYGFSTDYKQGRGHFYAIEDTRNTLRTGGPIKPAQGPMPATCWTCKSPDVPRLMKENGIAEFYKGQWEDKGAEIVNSIGCADCHDNETMDLRITRPALIEGFQAMGKDIGQASHQEMRSLVCAQCHVEYYFNKKVPVEGVPYLTFPWKNGQTAEDMLDYYNEIGFADWTHSLSKAPMLKAQHPGYEVYQTGIHAERGVSCADCHMPYQSQGGQKFTNHKMVSPLDNISASCQVCHRESESTLAKNVYDRQMKVIEIRDQAEVQLVRAHVEAKAAWDAGATEVEMKDVLQKIRAAQWFWDYVAASHGGSFHSPLETSRVVGKAIDNAQEARILLARVLANHGINSEIPYPDIATKTKAQKFIGLPMEKLIQEKEEFKKIVLPEWDRKAKEREAGYK